MPESADTEAPRSLLERVLMMLLFVLVFAALSWLVTATAIVQLARRLALGAPHPKLGRFGAGLGRYFGQVVAFLCFATEREPFPFSDWPDMTEGITPDHLKDL